MKRAIYILLPILLFSSCRILLNHKAKKMGYEGHFGPGYEWVNAPSRIYATKEQAARFDTMYNDIPVEWLFKIQSMLDSDILARNCYKFMYNTDSSKFLALFINDPGDPQYEMQAINWHGGTMLTSYESKDSIEFHCYMLWGIQYSGTWYYYPDDFYYISNKDLPSAKDYYTMIALCERCKYFKYFNTPEEETFWNLGGYYVFRDFHSGRFEPVDSTWTNDSSYWGLPRAVFEAKRDSLKYTLRRNEHAKEKNVLSVIQTRAQTSWDASEIIYNEDTTLFLVQIMHVDSGKYYVEYYFYNRVSDALYYWSGEPKKEVASDFGGLYMERDLSKRIPVKLYGHEHRKAYPALWEMLEKEEMILVK